MEHTNNQDITIFEAGIDTEGEVWAESLLGQASYEQYLQIVEMLLTDLYTETGMDKTILAKELQDMVQQLEPLPDAHHDHTHEKNE